MTTKRIKEFVLDKHPTSEAHYRGRDEDGKKVYYVSYPNWNFTITNVLGIGSSIKEAWQDAYECVLNN